MRRTEIITAAIVTTITFFTLQAFVGPRYRGPFGWHGYYHRHHYYGAPGCNDYYWRNRQNMPLKDSAW